MKILHYSLGFPPYRSGGLTKFCMDLMREQKKQGNEVFLLWPGEIKKYGGKTQIRTGSEADGISGYEVINPLPVSYDEGIKELQEFMRGGDLEAYEEFLNGLKPDVIHIHTLMGLHENLLTAARANGIRLVFTAHDFFPVCPKVTLFRSGEICDSFKSCEKCGVCNCTALSLNKIKILQSPLYRDLKDSAIVKKLRKQHRDEFLGDQSEDMPGQASGTPEDYKALRDYYAGMLSCMDVIHFNSSVTKGVYEDVFDIPSGKIIPITHSDIRDNRRTKSYDGDILKIRYLGPQAAGKGYYILKAALDQLWLKRQDFRLDVHFTPVESAPYIIAHERYDYGQLESIFGDSDILICPSVLYETFGYTVLEGLSYGVPVIVSGTAGAKDILSDGSGIVIEDINTEKIEEVIDSLTKEELTKMNSRIVSDQHIMTVSEMAERIEDECYGS